MLRVRRRSKEVKKETTKVYSPVGILTNKDTRQQHQHHGKKLQRRVSSRTSTLTSVSSLPSSVSSPRQLKGEEKYGAAISKNFDEKYGATIRKKFEKNRTVGPFCHDNGGSSSGIGGSGTGSGNSGGNSNCNSTRSNGITGGLIKEVCFEKNRTIIPIDYETSGSSCSGSGASRISGNESSASGGSLNRCGSGTNGNLVSGNGGCSALKEGGDETIKVRIDFNRLEEMALDCDELCLEIKVRDKFRTCESAQVSLTPNESGTSFVSSTWMKCGGVEGRREVEEPRSLRRSKSCSRRRTGEEGGVKRSRSFNR